MIPREISASDVDSDNSRPNFSSQNWELPTELWLEVFSTLTANDLLATIQVCRSWRNIGTSNVSVKRQWDNWSISDGLTRVAIQRLNNQDKNIQIIIWLADEEKIKNENTALATTKLWPGHGPSKTGTLKQISSMIPVGTHPYSISEIVKCLRTLHWIYDDQKANLIRALAKIPPETLAGIPIYARTLFNTSQNSDHSKANIIQALAQTYPDRLSIISQHAPNLFTQDMSGFDKAEIIKVLNEIQLEKIDIISLHAAKLFTTYMNGVAKAQIIQALNSIPKDIIPTVIEQIIEAVRIFTLNKVSKDIAPITEALVKFPQRSIHLITSHEAALFSKHMDGNDKAQIIKALALVPTGHFDIIAHYAPQLFTKNMESCYKAKIIKALAHTNRDDIPTIVSEICDTIRRTNYTLGNDGIAKITAALAQVPASYFSIIAEQGQELFTQLMDSKFKVHIIEAFAHVHKDDIARVAKEVVEIRRDFIGDMNPEESSRATAGLIKVYPNKLSNIAAHAQMLFEEGMTEQEKAQIIEGLAHIPDKNLDLVTKNILKLFTGNMRGWHKMKLIKAFSQVPSANIELIANHARIFFPDRAYGDYKTKIIPALAKIPTDSFSLIADQAVTLFTERMNPDDKAKIIKALSTIHRDYDIPVIEEALRIFNNTRYHLVGKDRAQIIYTLSKIPQKLFPLIVSYSNELMDKEMNGYDRANIIIALAKVPESNIKDVINQIKAVVIPYFTPDSIKSSLIKEYIQFYLCSMN